MNFNEELFQFTSKANHMKNEIQNEESTKMSLVVPFFHLLGYDVFNPSEFCPEFTADVGIKRGEKVDYAILVNGEPIIIIEVKSINKKLQKHDSQLFRYFSTTKARFAILTNGITYKFYSDLSEKNKMDMEPFYEFNLLNISEDDIKEISKFSKDNFDETEMIDNASLLKYITLFKDEIQAQLADPSDDFIRFFLKENYNGIKTQNVIDRFRPILKKALNDFIDQVVKGRMTSIINDSGYITTSMKNEDKDVPSATELDTLHLIREILNDLIDVNDITYKRTESYFGILYKGNTRKWIARLITRTSQITLIIPGKNKEEIRLKINSIEEINLHSNKIKEIMNLYLHPNKDSVEYIYTKWGKYKKPDPYKIITKKGFPPDFVPGL